MGTNYPGSIDVFNIPSDPTNTNLSNQGSGTRNHPQHHNDLGLAVMALEANAALLGHDHSGGTGDRPTNKLAQANTHQSADTDSGAAALHHSLGTGTNQAAAGNHAHTYEGIYIPSNDPYGWGQWALCTPQVGFSVPAPSQAPSAFPKGVRVRRHVSGIVCIVGMLNVTGTPAYGTKVIQLPRDTNNNLSWSPAAGMAAGLVVKSGHPTIGLTGLIILPDGGIYVDSPQPSSYIFLYGSWSAL